jgi:hypothetical protein
MMNKLLSLSDCRQSGNSRFRLYNVRKEENVTSEVKNMRIFIEKSVFSASWGEIR